MKEPLSSDHSVASLPDTPFRLLLQIPSVPKRGFGKEKHVKYLCGPVDSNGSIIARYLLYCPAIHYCILLLFPAIIYN